MGDHVVERFAGLFFQGQRAEGHRIETVKRLRFDIVDGGNCRNFQRQLAQDGPALCCSVRR
jgi:hypothetical protein